MCKAVATIPGNNRCRVLHVLLLATLGIFSFSGCTISVIPPAAPDDPRPVYLLDHGRHTSMVVSKANGDMVRYAYGEWRWYAEDDTGFWRSIDTLFTPTQGALGRRELAGPPTGDNVRLRVRVIVQTLHELQVAGDAADKLIQQLDAIHQHNPEETHYQPLYDLEFAPHPRDYSLAYHSKDALKGWLEMLGCEVSGGGPLSGWQVRTRSE